MNLLQDRQDIQGHKIENLKTSNQKRYNFTDITEDREKEWGLLSERPT